jgi:hypothetical protein
MGPVLDTLAAALAPAAPPPHVEWLRTQDA